MTQHRFKHATGTTEAVCHGQQAICAESFGNANTSQPSHRIAAPGVLVLQVHKHVFCCACARGARDRGARRGEAFHSRQRHAQEG